MGEEAASQVLENGRITVKSADGREYMITDSGKVYSLDTGERMREGGRGGKPAEVRSVLAKYLVIRDHPDWIYSRRRYR